MSNAVEEIGRGISAGEDGRIFFCGRIGGFRSGGKRTGCPLEEGWDGPDRARKSEADT